MKGYNVSSFFNKNEIRDLGEIKLYEKARLKTLEILLKCKKSTTGIKKFFPKRFKKDVTEDQKSSLSNAMKLFDIRNTIASLYTNGFIKSFGLSKHFKIRAKTKT